MLHPCHSSEKHYQNPMANRRSFLAELLDFIVQNKAWVIAPIILVLLLAGLLIVLGATKAAPFIYTLF